MALALGCNYGFQGGGGFPASIRTVYIEQFENQTVQFELENQLFNALTQELPRALGVSLGARETADAIVRGRITRYDDRALNYTSQAGRAPDVLKRQVEITIAVELIDTQRNVILWESSGVTANGEYSSDSQSDVVGRELAITDLVRRIIDGAQSQW